MRANEYGRPASAPPTYRYSNFFNSFTDLNLAPDLALSASSSNCSSPVVLSPVVLGRASLESTESCSCSVKTFSHFGNGGLRRSFSTLTSTMKGRTLSLRAPMFLRGRTTSTNSTSSLPTSIATTTSSTFSGKSKRLLAKVPKIFEFVLPFGILKIHRISKVPAVGQGLLTKRHKKPSTLDFRCIGMVGEDDFYFPGAAADICAPRIHWAKPDIHSDWKKDWFREVC